MNLIEVIVSVLIAFVAGGIAYLLPAVKAWINRKASNYSELIEDIRTFVVSASEIYRDNDEIITRVLKLIKRKYPDIDIDYVKAHIDTLLKENSEYHTQEK